MIQDPPVMMVNQANLPLIFLPTSQTTDEEEIKRPTSWDQGSQAGRPSAEARPTERGETPSQWGAEGQAKQTVCRQDKKSEYTKGRVVICSVPSHKQQQQHLESPLLAWAVDYIWLSGCHGQVVLVHWTCVLGPISQSCWAYKIFWAQKICAL